MRIGMPLSLAIIPVVGLSLAPSSSQAFDLNGAWATDAGVCQKIFERKGKSVSFRRESEVHGSGFIIERNSISGRTAKCSINTRRENGEIIHLVAACAISDCIEYLGNNAKYLWEQQVVFSDMATFKKVPEAGKLPGIGGAGKLPGIGGAGKLPGIGGNLMPPRDGARGSEGKDIWLEAEEIRKKVRTSAPANRISAPSLL